MKQTTKDTLKDVAVFAVVIAAAFIWVHLGANLESWISIPFITAVTYFGGILAAKSKTGKWDWEDGLLWGLLGLAAGTLFYFIS